MFFNLISCCYNKPITCDTLPKEETLLYHLRETAGYAKSLLDEKQEKVDYMQKEIGQLLLHGQEKRARLEVVKFIDDKNLSRILEIIIPFFRLIACRILSIESEREVPPEMKEAIATLCFVGTRSCEIPGLMMLRSHLCSMYGEEYIVNLTKCKPDCSVNKKIIKLLLLPNPKENDRNKVLREIAMKSKIKDWHPGYKCSFLNFDEDMSKKSQPRQWNYTYPDHNFVDEDMSSSSSSASASPKSMSHDNLEIVPVGWNKV